MDILCPKCAEPWDIDELHDYAEEGGTIFSDVYKAFRTKGCAVAFGDPVPCSRTEGSEARSVLADLLGDDVDGYASLLEDFGL
jgi:hypothetical protein